MGDFISGYHHIEGDQTYNTKMYLENVANANSPMVSSVEDMALFLKSLIRDDSFISQDIRDQMLAIDENEGHGLGIGQVTINGHTLYAHAGLTYGYHTQNIYIEDLDTSITAFINCSTQPVCENTMDAIIDTVLENEL